MIMATGFARFLPWSEGAVPCGASAMMACGWRLSSKLRMTDSDPAMVPNIFNTRSDMLSPSRLSMGITSGSPVVSSSSAYVASINWGSYRTDG